MVTNEGLEVAFTATTTTAATAATTKGEKHILSRIRLADFVSFLSYNQIQRFTDFPMVYFLVKLFI